MKYNEERLRKLFKDLGLHEPKDDDLEHLDYLIDHDEGLDQTEKAMIVARYGLDDKEPKQLKTIIEEEGLDPATGGRYINRARFKLGDQMKDHMAMNAKWVIKEGEAETTFPNFPSAFIAFSSRIQRYFRENEDAFDDDCVPFAVAAMFSALFEGKIGDRAIVAEARIRRACRCLRAIYAGATELPLSEVVLDRSKKAMDINETDPITGDALKGEIKDLGRVLSIDLRLGEGEDASILKTNALRPFPYCSPQADYYFISHQVISTSSQRELIGKRADLELELRRY